MIHIPLMLVEGAHTIDLNIDSAVFTLIYQTGRVSKIILLILLLISIFSWGIFIQKFLVFAINKRKIKKFKRLFQAKMRHKNPGDLIAIFSRTRGNILARSSLKGLLEIKDQLKVKRDKRVFQDMVFYSNAFQRAAQAEIAEILGSFERAIGFLATAGSVAPFLGLFGTVWGLMSAFQALGLKGATSIGAVAPGLAQALITTAAGLFTAIPAVISYNYLVNTIRVLQNEMLAFNAQVQGLVERFLFVSKEYLTERIKHVR